MSNGTMSATQLFREEYYTGNGKVDRDSRVIRDVKLVGKQSKWGYTYTDQALQGAVSLYEGVPVYVNHAQKVDGKNRAERLIEDKAGWIQNAQWKPDGVYGDFHFLESHPFTNRALEWAERNPKGIGFSQVAYGVKKGKGGRMQTVESLSEVSSVDLVGSPATTNGMFESFPEENKIMEKTLRELIESHGSDSEKANLSLLEESILDTSVEIDESTEDSSAVASGFQSAVTSLFAEGGNIDEGVNKILAARSILTNGVIEESIEKKISDYESLVESLQSELNAIKEERKYSALLEEHSVKSTPVRLRHLSLSESQAERLELIEGWKDSGKPASSGRKESSPETNENSKTNFLRHRK